MTDAVHSTPWEIAIPDERRLRLLAEIVAVKVSAGDMITLQGALGAGKTTFSRYLIRALAKDDDADVPSPTFTLVQTYETARFEIRHFDLYRLSGPDELQELDFADDQSTHLTLVEWPERAGDMLGACRFDVIISDGDGANENGRTVTLSATPDTGARLQRMQAHYDFLVAHYEAEALSRLRLSFLQGDASARGYARVKGGDGDPGADGWLLMDMPRMPDGPVIRDGQTYSEIAHLAEDARPFVAIADALRTAGLSAPKIHAFNAANGMALIEDLGPLTFAEAMASSVPQRELWHAAVEVLVGLRGHRPDDVVGGEITHRMPRYDAGVMLAELELLCDWYWPHITGKAMAAKDREAFMAAWQPLIARVAWQADRDETRAWVLRDFHSPNLIWLPERQGIERVGVIDFQDAQIGHAAYDLVSLSLDARLDVPRPLHEALVDDYCAQVKRDEATFDEASFRRAAAILGAQRNTKILGIFARLSMRDRKHGYLRHIPRIRSYVEWCLEHPELNELRAVYRDVLELDRS